MLFKNTITLVIILILTCKYANAQQTIPKTDSSHLYENIATYSEKGKFTKFMYQFIFKPIPVKSKEVKKKVYKKLIQKPYAAFNGKIIRYINIETCDPFGYSAADTSAIPQNLIFKAGNKLHVKSRRITIRNLLLIRQSQIFDSLLVKESERLVRSRGYVHDVSFFVIACSTNSDSVDINIRVLDNWSILPNAAISASGLTIDLTDKNFLGLGHESENSFNWYFATHDYAYNINYFIPNLRNTYINTRLHYANDKLGNYIRNLDVDRPFFSPFAKWAAGVNILQQFRKDSVRQRNSLSMLQKLKFNSQDYWAGSAIQIFKGNSENNRTTNLISTLRFLQIKYLEKPGEMIDTLHIYSNEHFYLFGIGISTRKYVQDKFIFKYNVTEDVPIGKVYKVIAGYQIKNNINRLYLGGCVSLGNYYSWGYLSSNIEYGTFFHNSYTEQGVFSVGANYFTGLFEIGRYKFRQFIKPQFIFGINRFTYDSLTLNSDYGIIGFNSPELSGTNRILLMLQTQTYTPWKVIGFHFGPYLICSFGRLGGAENGLRKSKLYSQIGIGVLIKNENLVFNTFQISVAFYPIIPGRGQNIFKMNSFRSTSFGFRDFEIGKPAITAFQ